MLFPLIDARHIPREHAKEPRLDVPEITLPIPASQNFTVLGRGVAPVRVEPIPNGVFIRLGRSESSVLVETPAGLKTFKGPAMARWCESVTATREDSVVGVYTLANHSKAVVRSASEASSISLKVPDSRLCCEVFQVGHEWFGRFDPTWDSKLFKLDTDGSANLWQPPSTGTCYFMKVQRDGSALALFEDRRRDKEERARAFRLKPDGAFESWGDKEIGFAKLSPLLQLPNGHYAGISSKRELIFMDESGTSYRAMPNYGHLQAMATDGSIVARPWSHLTHHRISLDGEPEVTDLFHGIESPFSIGHSVDCAMTWFDNTFLWREVNGDCLASLQRKVAGNPSHKWHPEGFFTCENVVRLADYSLVGHFSNNKEAHCFWSDGGEWIRVSQGRCVCFQASTSGKAAAWVEERSKGDRAGVVLSKGGLIQRFRIAAERIEWLYVSPDACTTTVVSFSRAERMLYASTIDNRA